MIRKNLLLLLLAGLFLNGCKQPETTTAQVRDMTISIYAPGRLVDPETYLLHAPAQGILTDWKVEEGDTVKAEQLLATIDGSNSKLNQENARARMEELRKNLRPGSSFQEELRLAVSAARLKYQDDSLNYDRQKRLWEKKVGTQRELEMKKLAMESSQRQYQSSQESRSSRLSALRTDLQTAENLYTISTNQNQDYNVTSKIDGVLLEKLKNAGEWVAPQQPLGKLGGAGSFILELEVDEVDIVKAQVGQQTLIALDAYPDQIFQGKVSQISSEKDPLSQSYKIEVLFNKRPDRWFAGMTAEANIILQEKKDVLLLPRRFIIGKNQVITESGDTLSLKIGESDLEFAEILGGLTAETKLIQPGS